MMSEKESNEQTWDDVENRWRMIDEILERHNLKSTSDPIPGEADWVHAMDVADKIVEFESKLESCDLCDEPAEYRQCQGCMNDKLIGSHTDEEYEALEAKNAMLRKAWIWDQLKFKRAGNRRSAEFHIDSCLLNVAIQGYIRLKEVGGE